MACDSRTHQRLKIVTDCADFEKVNVMSGEYVC